VSRCEVATDRDPHDGYFCRCEEDAKYTAHDWGHGPGSEEIGCCTSHAVDAFRAGAKVTGDDGQVYDWTDDHDPIYVEPVEVAS
jgi:hypothetical protein